MKYQPMLLFNDYPVVMYCCKEQKLVAVFRSKRTASVYIFEKNSTISSVTISDKKVHKNNPYNTPITFRTATDEQKTMIPDKEMFFIIDERFRISERKPKTDKILNGNLPVYKMSFIKKVKDLKKEGYTQQEMSEILCVSRTTISVSLGKDKRTIPNDFSKLGVEELEVFEKMLSERIKRIKKETITHK